ncbi:unnamed protein product [Lota lota]
MWTRRQCLCEGKTNPPVQQRRRGDKRRHFLQGLEKPPLSLRRALRLQAEKRSLSSWSNEKEEKALSPTLDFEACREAGWQTEQRAGELLQHLRVKRHSTQEPMKKLTAPQVLSSSGGVLLEA